jgi:hypothetical protein
VEQEYWLSYTTLAWDSRQGQHLALQGGLLFPPGLLIDGEPFSYGRLSERRLRRELDRREGLRAYSTCQVPEETQPVGGQDTQQDKKIMNACKKHGRRIVTVS